jgi:ADP-heptose:LPS heptosyltransferase
VDFVSLQFDRGIEQIAQLPGRQPIRDASCDIHDFADTAALVSQLDLVIAVDTAVAHLAGALGKPVWVLLPLAPDWRWMLGRKDSPWYPTMRLFRQQRAMEWDPVIVQVRKQLQIFADSRD